MVSMLYLVHMTVEIPRELTAEERKRLATAERERSAALQRAGKWTHLWRVAGRYANVSVFEVDSHDELHDILWSLPFFPYLTIEITPLSRHPSKIADV
jgi:muconolactone D-isomerase